MDWNSTALPWNSTSLQWKAKPTADDVPVAYGGGLQWNDPRLPWKE